MAVNLTGLEPSGGVAVGSAKKASASQVAAPPPQGGDQAAPQQGEVSITSTAALLASLEQSLAQVPAFDQQRVDAISAALAAGTYQVEPDKVAGGLIQSERALGGLPLAEL